MISASPPAPLQAATPTHLLCALGPLTLGFEALTVREVLALPLISPLSQAPPLVAGAVNLRGRVVPVVDLRAALHLEAAPPATTESLVVLEEADQTIAVRVDHVRNVASLCADFANGAAAPDGLPTGFIAGAARDGWDIVQLVHLPALLGAALAPTSASANGARWLAPDVADHEILAARARTLARPFQNAAAAREGVLLAAATLDGEFFGFELQHIREFRRPPPCHRPLTRVPLGATRSFGPHQPARRSFAALRHSPRLGHEHRRAARTKRARCRIADAGRGR